MHRVLIWVSLALLLTVARANAYWSDTSTPDGMSGKTVRLATVNSNNSFTLGPPYEGAQKATVVIRQHPRKGLDIMVGVERGQIVCDYSDCSILVRFGNSTKPESFRVDRPTDGSSDLLFIADQKRFISRMRTVSLMSIELVFFHQSSRVIDFNVEDLPDWVPGGKSGKGNKKAK